MLTWKFSLFLICWQTALKLLAGDEEELLKIIPIILGCKKENFIEMDEVQEVLNLVKETSYSHLMEASNPLVMCLVLLLFYPFLFFFMASYYFIPFFFWFICHCLQLTLLCFIGTFLSSKLCLQICWHLKQIPDWSYAWIIIDF